MTSKKLLFGMLLAFTITIFITSNNVFADSTGDTPPTLAATSPASISEFINENNAFVSDNNRAIGFINFDQAYGAFGFDISIPDGSTINGITVKIEGRKSPLCGAIIGSPTFSVKLSDPSLVGNPTGLGSFTSIPQTTTSFGTSDSTKTLGSSTDLWGNVYSDVDNLWILVTSKCGLLITSMQLDQVTVDVDYSVPVILKSGHHCTNCQQPSIGVTDKGKRVVTGGIMVNGQGVDADFYHTAFPLIQADMNEPVTMRFIIWDDVINNISHVEVGLGKGKIGESFGGLDTSMIWNKNLMSEEETITFDESAFKDVYMTISGKVPCKETSGDVLCDQFDVKFTPVKAIVGDVVFGISIWDGNHNAMTTYFNHGLQIGTESDVIPIVEFVAPEGNGNRPMTEDNNEECNVTSFGVYDRHCQQFKWQLIGQQLIAEEMKKSFGY